MNILEDFYSPAVLFPEHSYSASGVYHQIQPTYDLNVSTNQGCAQGGLLGGGPGVLWTSGCWETWPLPASHSFLLIDPSHKDSPGAQVLWGEAQSCLSAPA